MVQSTDQLEQGHRIELHFSDDAWEKIQKLMDATNLPAEAVVCNALGHYLLSLEFHEKGYTIGAIRGRKPAYQFDLPFKN